MVDLALMARLAMALAPTARLVLLGDRDQLASVEAGAVLGDVCGDAPGFSGTFRARVEGVLGRALPAARSVSSPLTDSIVLLRESHRFGGASGIGRLASAVNVGDAAAAVALLQDEDHPDVCAADGGGADLARMVVAGYATYHERVGAGADPAALFEALGEFRVLCAHRRGPQGARALNAIMDGERAARDVWYPGRPVLITENDYALRLFNGDVGIALADPEAGGELRVFFEGDARRMRRLSPARLPPHETTYAMTIHKSQGSEFGRVLLVLPPEDSRLLTRELLYTGITRAREAVTIWGSTLVLGAGIERGLARSSGLRDALWVA